LGRNEGPRGARMIQGHQKPKLGSESAKFCGTAEVEGASGLREQRVGNYRQPHREKGGGKLNQGPAELGVGLTLDQGEKNKKEEPLLCGMGSEGGKKHRVKGGLINLILVNGKKSTKNCRVIRKTGKGGGGGL